ncbi:riboflavin transporter FmnP [Weizmannia acidilactici]|uniref:Riboflavin transporter n=1 Tax=Weizmannia acidilactici TaxID=2607726 RepID=A0A5J4JG62_9BACI|nr:ECF transporter S component [Weizmannia acidilactici]GER66057.1 riboflavin transporter FmnP [Weizmannia acidilactici]GER69308.1 riboflavin transporter FmnP [Weizmannia acidilactici]GER72366.1 riboflavin transporter FmnP [Weizmannia acidilactici]
MKKWDLKKFVSIALLSTLAFILMFIKFPIPPFPSFLTVDFSDVPVLVAALLYGPMASVVAELIKNILNYLSLGSEAGVPIGNAANFFAGILFVLPTYFIYRRMRTKKGMTVGLIAGTVSMSVFMSILNYFVILPAYLYFMNFSVGNVKQYIVAGVLPFNLVKGVIVTILFMLMFTKMKNWIDKQSTTGIKKI